MAKKMRQQTRKKKTQKGVAIYHDMKVYENFERSALRIFECIKQAEKSSPGAPRFLYIDIQGHRNEAGGYDHDAFELIKDYALGFLRDYLTEIHTPLYDARNPGKQRNDIPDALQINHPDDGSKYGYDAGSLGIQPREKEPANRKTAPTVRAIADYLGMEEAACLVCWRRPVERAHVVPTALGGSMDVRNFALLCRDHHAEAPDVADAESFWAWIDYAELRDSPEKWVDAPEELKEFLQRSNVRIGKEPREPLSFFSAVKEELKSLYGWGEGDFEAVAWSELMDEFHSVLDTATGRHFSIDKKVSTYAWAYDIALRRVKGAAGRIIRDTP
ncbi:HNH endonuclease signature motif containing protein [Streptomyces malaysiensis]|uniref:HNH endonuclease signature motif containing protein n=1 Tax=Streptomyces malaysiensis TaxID=92644 RepID=UPI001F435F68|nr:HNH endonuclease [Streptomyces autolyticus]